MQDIASRPNTLKKIFQTEGEPSAVWPFRNRPSPGPGAGLWVHAAAALRQSVATATQQ